MNNSSFGKGFIYGIASYILWGSLPIYWRLLVEINPFQLLGFRIIFSLVFVGSVLFLGKNYSWIKFYKDKQTRVYMFFMSVFVCINWGLYIWAVNNGYTIEASLGYYIAPLMMIVMGLVLFKEKQKPLQLVAFIFALIGVAILTLFTGKLPWISICLALSWTIYSFLKKTVNLSSLESLGAETLIASPLGVFLIFSVFGNGEAYQFLGTQALTNILKLTNFTIIMLLICGVATSTPLYLFAKAVRILPLTSIGFLQFLSPTMTFLIGLLIFREHFPVRNFFAFGFIWIAAIFYIISLMPFSRKKKNYNSIDEI